MRGYRRKRRLDFETHGTAAVGETSPRTTPIDRHVQLVDQARAFSTVEVRCRTNPLGMKGAGEAGAIGAPPAVINAVVDALSPLGVRHVDMPATPERLWRLVAERSAAKAA